MSWRDLYPFEPNYLHLGSPDTHRMHYVDQGPEKPTGKPVLMVHGNPTWSFYYRNLVQALSSERRAIAVDHMGCGLSDKPAEYPYTLSKHIDNLCQLADTLDLRDTTLVAHDWGGAIGLGTLLKRQQRFSRIILFNTAAFPPPYIPLRIRVCRWPLVGQLALQGLNLFARAATRMATEQPGGLPTDVAAGMLAPYDSWQHRVATYRFVKDIPLRSSHPTWKVLKRIESQLDSLANWPSLLVWGMKDWCFRPECLDRFQRHWPNAEVHRCEDAGHYVVEDAIDTVVSQVQAFLKRHDA